MPRTRTESRTTTNAIMPLIRRGGGGVGVTIVAGTRVRGRSVERLEPVGAAMRAGGPETARAGGPEMARGTAGLRAGGRARRGVGRYPGSGAGESGSGETGSAG